MIKRTLSKKLKQLASKFSILSIVGSRQSGKTTLVRSVFPKADYVNLEDLDSREFALRDPRGFLSTYNKEVIIDEAQRVPELFSYIQTESDKRRKTGRFILTGSQNFLLHEKISQSLAGRVAMLKLLPFSVAEISGSKYELSEISDYIFTGFYPGIYDKEIDPMDWYPNYIQTFVERDVRLIKNISDLNTFQKFLKLCAGRTGQILNLSSLGNDCGITHNTAKSWLSILEASYVIFLLKPYYKNFNKRLVKMPKLYFYDTGLVCSLMNIQNAVQLTSHYLYGSLFETFVLSEIIKYRFNRGTEHNCYYWRDKTGNELDCIVDMPDGSFQVEIKSSKTIAEDFFDGFRYWNNIAGNAGKRACLVYGGSENQKRSIADIISWKNIPSIFE